MIQTKNSLFPNSAVTNYLRLVSCIIQIYSLQFWKEEVQIKFLWAKVTVSSKLFSEAPGENCPLASSRFWWLHSFWLHHSNQDFYGPTCLLLIRILGMTQIIHDSCYICFLDITSCVKCFFATEGSIFTKFQDLDVEISFCKY